MSEPGDSATGRRLAAGVERVRFNTPSARLAGIVLFALAMAAVTFRLALGSDPVTPLALIFWVQLAVGLGAMTISGWVWALRPRELATRLFALSGLATLIFTLAAASRSGAVIEPRSLAVFLMWLNAGGATLFGAAMIVLFLVYPVRLPNWRSLALVSSVGFALWTVATLLGRMPAWSSVHLITLVEMGGIFLAVAAQFLATAKAPKDRAVAIWFGLSVLFGAGGFIGLIALPAVLGHPAPIKAGYAFACFLLIYIGVAAGLRQYRLFELGEWAFRILFYVVGTLILVALDAALVGLLSLRPGPAIGISLLVVGFLYLPLRDAVARRFVPQPGLSEQELFHAVVDLAFQTSLRERAGQWRQLVTRLFDPLDCHGTDEAVAEPAIREDGIELVLPPIGDISALSLRYPWAGRALFGPSHVKTAQRLVQMMAHADASRDAYDRGVTEERTRIARDMHDNIGAQLLGALHSRDDDRKNSMIRETLTDLRDIINDASGGTRSLDETLADLRLETAERLASVGIALEWVNEAGDLAGLPPQAGHALRSLLREAASNVLKHSGASVMRVEIRYDGNRAELVIEDDGSGFDPADRTGGNGLANMQGRLAGLDGRLEILPSAAGTRLAASFPLPRRGAVA
ncbi:ATP-binding protein [uncultured Maricaulis sp.]|uniref:ATP-binding protein n=1 Tax=uncultured Maricaulis sp. TaxID=174710 RepID=UPI0030DA8ECB|tara:strand:+ start:7945 stop:9840 length:1896 start_codon:yes stop_codon:yes gene_type:complete